MKRIVAVFILVSCLLASPTSAFGLTYYVLGLYNNASWSGCRSVNKVPSSIAFGSAGSYDAAVNTVYAQKDELNGVEFGWEWERFANGTISGPKMFGAEKYNGVWYYYKDKGGLTKGSSYTWFVKRSSGVWVGGVSSTSKVIYKSTFLYGKPVTGVERQLSGCRVSTNFSSMRKMNSGGTWSTWPSITFQWNDPYYRPTGNTSAWNTVH